MFGFLRRGPSPAELRVEIQEYVRAVQPLLETFDRMFTEWTGGDGHAVTPVTLTLVQDPDGTRASVYIWKVGDAAREFVSREPSKAVRRHYEAMALCLEARAAAADAFKNAADRVLIQDPAPQLALVNRSLAEAGREQRRADEALVALKEILARR